MKNNMKTSIEKEKIVLRYINSESPTNLSHEYEINIGRLFFLEKKYESNGIEGLNSNTGIHLKKPKDKIEELELEIMKKDIEIARLKKRLYGERS